LFSAFPGGLPGVGLFLMRNMVGAWMIVQAVAYFGGAEERDLLAYAAGALAAISGVLLVLGFLTPIASIVASAWSLKAAWLILSTAGLYEAGPLLRPGVVALALALIGPGAISIDCRLFGRRQIIIPHSGLSSHHHDLL
jgi:uncharacterized membrane protein YphA (DoxX/SURF4 family)